jgi:peptide/nickel transport system ATP-binding protein
MLRNLSLCIYQGVRRLRVSSSAEGTSSRSLISLESVDKIYRVRKFLTTESIVAVENFNMTVEEDRSSVITLTGESGSGKTTVAKMILGLEEPTRGIVRYRGYDLRRLGERIGRDIGERFRQFSRIPIQPSTPSTE